MSRAYAYGLVTACRKTPPYRPKNGFVPHNLKPQTLNTPTHSKLSNCARWHRTLVFPPGNYCPYPFDYEKKGPVKIPGSQ